MMSVILSVPSLNFSSLKEAGLSNGYFSDNQRIVGSARKFMVFGNYVGKLGMYYR